MENPLPRNVRVWIYFLLVAAGIVVSNLPDVVEATQTGDWSRAAASLNATIAQLAGVIALANLTPEQADEL